ncbi:HEAT repeat-containing protein 6 [Nowakowskiella sp. JEL0407]|nr:HEAT repeat-containing protein 6 [Nowakowskiella sp. JEL0407]
MRRFGRRDFAFTLTFIKSLEGLVTDKNLNVRVRGSWGLGNLCDAFTKLGESESGKYSDESISKLINLGIFAAKDNDKCRSNGVRALGNIVKFCPREMLTPDLTSQIAQTILKNIESGSDKLRWNSCYAIGNILSNNSLPVTDALFTQLCILQYCSASSALANAKAEHFGSSEELKDTGLSQCATNVKRGIEVLVNMINNIDNLEETQFSEVKYKEQLSNQLRKTISYIFNLFRQTTVNDELSWYFSSISISQYTQ